MCGICGFVGYSKNITKEEGLVRKMCEAMKHRGPDGEGIFSDIGSLSVCLGHRRLSIIDLSQSGRQPMTNEDGTVWIVFNGEIYNFRELREGLEKRGHRFNSKTDTEVIIHLFEDCGEECVNFLRGMFAFAIWDKKEELLFLARDRVGKKPLFYYQDGENFYFASEFAALLESGKVKKTIDRRALDYYITFGYIPAPLSIYQNVCKLMPGQALIVKENRIRLKHYWQPDYSAKINISEDEAAQRLLALLEEAVKIRLSSDVPLGVFLSGGIDSSTIVGLMSRLTSKVRTFSIGFEERGYDELTFARNIADRFGTEHNEFIVRPNAMEVLPSLIERYGEPYADSSCIPTYYVSRETRKYVTVALNGDGGDELFAGYERYQAMLIADVYEKMPSVFKKITARVARILPDSLEHKNKLRRLRRFIDAAGLPEECRYIRWVSIFDPGLKKMLYNNDFLASLPEENRLALVTSYLSRADITNLLDRLLLTDTCSYLPGDLLVKVDIASMTNSLEARSPFLDQKVMEFAARLPAGYKIKGLVKKYILKKAVSGFLPRENIHRRKMGFGMPIGKWFREDLKGLLTDTLLSEVSLKRGYFQPETVKGMVKEHLAGKKDNAFQLWSLLMLELWHRRFYD